jgi:hypothetical protein
MSNNVTITGHTSSGENILHNFILRSGVSFNCAGTAESVNWLTTRWSTGIRFPGLGKMILFSITSPSFFGVHPAFNMVSEKRHISLYLKLKEREAGNSMFTVGSRRLELYTNAPCKPQCRTLLWKKLYYFVYGLGHYVFWDTFALYS